MTLSDEEIIESYNIYIKMRFPKSFDLDVYNNDLTLKYYDVGHVQFYTTELNGKFMIGILGSNETLDWLFNFIFNKRVTPYKEKGTNRHIKVHNGFYRSYLKIRDIIHEEVKDKDSVYFLGQSFGSAVATLAALDVQYNFPDIENIENYLTGTPRVGNKEFVYSYNKRVPKTYRFINGFDLVTIVPFKIFGFAHVIGEILLKERERKNLFNFIKMGIKNHLARNYYRSLLEYFRES